MKSVLFLIFFLPIFITLNAFSIETLTGGFQRPVFKDLYYPIDNGEGYYEKTEFTDKLFIYELSENEAYVFLNIHFENGRECYAEGIATKYINRIVYRNRINGFEKCDLEIILKSGNISIKDENNACSEILCGANTSLNLIDHFQLSSKRKIAQADENVMLYDYRKKQLDRMLLHFLNTLKFEL